MKKKKQIKFVIYTDYSGCQKTNTAAYSIIITQNGEIVWKKAVKLPAYIKPHEGEMMAVMEAIQLATDDRKNNNTDFKIVIRTDCLNVVKTVKNPHKWLTLKHIKGHHTSEFNKAADQLARITRLGK